MAQLVSLAAYSIKVWNTVHRKSEVVSAFATKPHNGAKASDLLDFLKGTLGALRKQTSQQDDIQHILTVRKLMEDDRILYGIIETGEYGVESDLLDIETKALAHHRKMTEADMRPFYFLVDVPEGPDEAVLLLQRSGALGIRKVLHQAVAPTLERQFPELRLRIQPLVDAQQFMAFLKGRVEEVRFTRFGIPHDFTDAYDSGHNEVEGSVELVVKARKRKHLPINGRLLQFATGKKELANLIALHDINFDYDDIKVKTKVGKSRRTVDLANPARIRSYHDISGEVQLGKDGHPKFDSIHKLALNLLKQTKKALTVQQDV